MLGLNAMAQLSVAGAGRIIAVDPNAERLQLASAFGATHCTDSADQQDIHRLVTSLTDGRGADIVLDFAGVGPAVETCLATVRTGGCVLLAGSVFPSAEISISPEHMVRRMLTIRGLHNYLAEDVDCAIRFLQRTQNQFPFRQLVAASFALQEVEQPGLHLDCPSIRCVGYRQAWLYLHGEYDQKQFNDKALAATRQLAKRQLTWLRHWPIQVRTSLKLVSHTAIHWLMALPFRPPPTRH